jgi:hypothetical protein
MLLAFNAFLALLKAYTICDCALEQSDCEKPILKQQNITGKRLIFFMAFGFKHK